MKKGVDISEHNGDVNIKALKTAGIEFVIIRCGYGSDFSHQDDGEFEKTVHKCREAGMPYGVYLYSYATSAEMAKSEVAHTLRLLKGKKPDYGVWYDVEDKSQIGAPLVEICQTYCDAIQAAGYYCGIYSFLAWLNSYLNDPRLDKYDKWVAQWNNKCDYKGNYGLWQYTDEEVINGKPFDCNYSYRDYPTLTGGGNLASRVLQTKENQVTNPYGNGHSGVDVVGYYNQLDNIVAHSDGVVEIAYTWNGKITSGNNNSYGNFVKICHPNGYATLYAHLAKQIMKQGQNVRRGDVIGAMGNTGNSYGAHLHFEVFDPSGNRIDPTPYLNKNLSEKDDEEMLTYEQWKEYQERYEKELAAKPISKWAEKAVEYCKEKGIMNGDADGNFRPQDSITRQEVAQVAFNMKNK